MIKQIITDILEIARTDNVNTLPSSVKKNIDTVLKSYERSKAPLKAIIAAGIPKIAYPEWDVRKHQQQIGGKHSLRSIDTRHIASELYRIGLYETPTSFALTRSFEKAECYDMNYSGNIYQRPFK